MSSYGTYSISLRQDRLEELRRQREEQRKQEVRQEATKLIADSRRASRQFQDHMTQYFGQNAQQLSENLARQAEQLLRSNPDQALQLARRSYATVERGMAEASHKTAEWTQEKITAEEAVAVLRLALEGTLNSFVADNDNSSSQLIPVAHQLAAAKAALRRENFEAAKELALTGQKQIRKIEQAHYQQQEAEEIRREIVRGLRDVLNKMGFVVKKPKLDQGSENGKVVLIGTLPSEAVACFVIAIDGQVDYSFMGYRHHDCGKHHTKIRSQLEEDYQMETSDLQVEWTEPKQLPAIARGISIDEVNYSS